MKVSNEVYLAMLRKRVKEQIQDCINDSVGDDDFDDLVEMDREHLKMVDKLDVQGIISFLRTERGAERGLTMEMMLGLVVEGADEWDFDGEWST